MYGLPVSSPGRRFLKTLLFSLLMAVLCGALFALLVYFRLPHTVRVEEDEDTLVWHEVLRNRLEDLEQVSYDARARELGKRSDDPQQQQVVLVPIDEEAVQSARRDEHPGIGMQPWPREILGGVVDRLIREGSALVVLDSVFPDASPSTCPTQLTSAPTDDDAFRSLLERRPNQAMLGFAGSLDRVPPEAAPKPYLVFLERRPSRADAFEAVRRVLEDRRPAFVVPDGRTVKVYAGVSSEDEGRALAERWEVKGVPEIREYSPERRADQVSPVDLLVARSEIQVEGIEVDKLPQARSLNHPTPALLTEKALYGALTLEPDADGGVRGVPHLIRYESLDGRVHVLPSAPLAAAMRLAGTRKVKYQDGRLWVGDKYSVPVDASGYALVRWDSPEAGRDGRGSLHRSISVWRIVVNMFDALGALPPHYRNELEGKVAVLANTSSYGEHFVQTPIGRAVRGAVVGQALVDLLRSDGITRADPQTDVLFTLAMAFVGAFLALTFGPGFRSRLGGLMYVLLVPAAAVAYGVFAFHEFVEHHRWIAMAGPLLALGTTFFITTVYALRLEARLREFVIAALGRVSPEVARKVTGNPSLMRPERRDVTVYFADIEGFTRLSQLLAPEKLVALLNEVLGEMTQVVRQNGGQVDKYIGDTISAFWGAPLRTDRHAEKACEAALGMREAIKSRQRDWELRYGHRLEFRAGLNSGEAVAGDMGTDLKSNYTVIGDVVSLASRLERENRSYGTFILAGESTVRASSDKFVFREVDRVRVQGKPMPVLIYELIGRRSAKASAKDSDDGRPAWLGVYEAALLAYHERRFLEALELFNRLEAEQQDPLAAVYVRRCDHYLDVPPPEAWDGVFEAS